MMRGKLDLKRAAGTEEVPACGEMRKQLHPAGLSQPVHQAHGGRRRVLSQGGARAVHPRPWQTLSHAHWDCRHGPHRPWELLRESEGEVMTGSADV